MTNGINVKLLSDDAENREFKSGQTGVVVGFVRGANDRPYAVVQIENRLIMCSLYFLEVLNP